MPCFMCQYAIRLLLLLLLVYVPITSAEPHPHQGVLQPYREEPPTFSLSDKEQQALYNFKAVYKKWQLDGHQRGVAIFRVAASVARVWSVLHQFEQYPQWIAELKSTEVYEREGNTIYVAFTASHWLLGKTRWYVKHDFPAVDELSKRNWGSWTLDYRHRSDFNDSVGFWQVRPVAGTENISEVIYSVDLRMGKSTPAFIRRAAINKGLKQASQWVKQQAELPYSKN